MTASAPACEPPPSTHRRPPLLDVAARSDRGREREGNEDSYLVVTEAGFAALAVCDGMGGAAGGEVASRAAADAIGEALTCEGYPPCADALGRRLLESVEGAARTVFEMARRTPRLAGMGTTVTACALRGADLFLAQVGDSRAYLLRDGALTQLTRDQTLVNLLLERGQLAPEDVASFGLGHVILQAAGTHERVEVDLGHVRVHRGDVILVCSDGLHGVLSAATIRDLLELAPTADAACEALVAAANEAGGPDNITCVVARVLAGSPPAGPPIPTKPVLEPAPADDSYEVLPSCDAQGEDDARAESVLSRLAAIFRRRQRA